MRSGNAFTGFIQKMNNSRRKISKLVNDPKLSKTYFPQTPRKSKWGIWRDNLLWLTKHREVNHYYYLYGLDRKNIGAEKEVLPYRIFRRIRDSRNQHPKDVNFNYASLLRDKFIFGQLLSSLQFPTPKNIALINNGQLTWLDSMKTVPLTSIAQETKGTIDGFCKKLTGQMGEGAFPLRIQEGKIYNSDTELSAEQLEQKIIGHYLFQERIAQHPNISILHPYSVNTIRLITFNNQDKIEVFSGSMRIGTKKRKVDNWNSGGIAVSIDLQSGTLRGPGFYKPGFGGCVEAHPDSGVELHGYQLPYFKESIDLVCRLHRYLYGIHSIGWDIAITPNGPILVEGNDDWDGSMPMALERNFKSRFLQMFSNNGRASHHGS